MEKLASLGLLSVLSFSTIARADLSFTQTTINTAGAQVGAGEKTKTFVKNGLTRSEAKMLDKPLVILTKPSGETIQIDPTTKTYTVGFPGQAEKGQPVGSFMDTVVSVKNLGFQTLQGQKAPHWKVDLAISLKAGAQSFPMTMGCEIWSGTTPFEAVASTSKPSSKSIPPGVRSVLAGNFKLKGDLPGLARAYATVPLRTQLTSNGKVVARTETSEISTEPLPAHLFTIPTGYTKISIAQWDKRFLERVQAKNAEAQAQAAPSVSPEF